MMPTILSVENELMWSWGNSIHQLIACLPQYEFVRCRRGLFYCEDCGSVYMFPLGSGFEEHFDVLMAQNVETARHLEIREKIILRLGGFLMDSHFDPNCYANDFRSVGAIIATNEQLASFARPVNPNTTVIPNGVDLDHFKPRPSFPDRPDRPFTIGFAGNIDGMGGPYKGWKFFVEAGINLMMEGVREKHVLYKHAQIPHNDMPEKFYWEIDALILPSQGEGCSNVVTEALACGVPVIMTKVGFHGEKLVDYENVVYITRDTETASPETTEQICNAVRRLMREPDLYRRLSQGGRDFAVEHHDIKKVAAQYDAVFQGLLALERTADHDSTSVRSQDGTGHSG